jgi:hypothetical protein
VTNSGHVESTTLARPISPNPIRSQPASPLFKNNGVAGNMQNEGDLELFKQGDTYTDDAVSQK